MRRRLCAAILSLQAIVLGLTTPVLISVVGVRPATGLAVGLGLLAACVVTTGLLGHSWAYGLGWAVQIVSIGLGTLIASMYVLGVVFLVLYATAYLMGGKIERERAEWEAAARQRSAEESR